jgi:hypothetical protein
MRTIFLKASQHLPWYETLPKAILLNRYSQLLIYLVALGIIAYLYIVANGLFMQYLADLTANSSRLPAFE